MVIQKIYLLAGLLLWIGAVFAQVKDSDEDTLAFVGLMMLAIGLMQSHVKLPAILNFVLLAVFLVGAGGFFAGGRKGDLAGAICWTVVFLCEGAGVFRFSGAPALQN